MVDPAMLAPHSHAAACVQDPSFDAEPLGQDGLLTRGGGPQRDPAPADWLARLARPDPLGFVRLDRAALAPLDPHCG